MKKSKTLHMIPEAVDVQVVGGVMVGATVRGFYIYNNSGGAPEGLSRFYWHLNGVRLDDEGLLDITLIPADANKYLQFSVIPVAADGAVGSEYFSQLYEVTSGFQNISDEENEGCYVKQHGNFSLGVSEPADRMAVSTGGVFAIIDSASGDTYLKGQNGFGLPVPPDIAGYLINNRAIKLFSTEGGFAALVVVTSTNQLLCWGRDIPVALPRLDGIRSVYSTRSAFAVIYRDPAPGANRIAAIGPVNLPVSTVPDAIQRELLFDPPEAIYAADDAFAVRTQNGRVYAWGNPDKGGTIPPVVRDQLASMFVTTIVATAIAFCAITADGEFAVWGNTTGGGAIPIEQLNSILNDGGIESVIAATTAFCAITRGRRRAVSWGRTGQGGNMSAGAAALALGGKIILCKANRWAFLIANESGRAEAWGAPGLGGDPLPPQVKKQFKAAFNGARAVPGDPPRSCVKPELQRQRKKVSSRAITVGGILSLFANDHSFFLLSRNDDGTTHALVLHGLRTSGGEMSVALRQTLMASYIRDVKCTSGAYGVIGQQGGVDGTVSVWGLPLRSNDAGEIPPELAEFLRSSVVELYSIKRFPYVGNPPAPGAGANISSFAARRADGTWVLWGGNVVNEHFQPSSKR